MMNTSEASLQGLTVLLTRPSKQTTGIAAAVEKLGGKVCQLPLIEIEPVQDVAEMESIKARILSLDRYDMAIFISTNAAALGLEWIDRYWPQLPLDLCAFAVGPGTAAILRRLNWRVSCSDRGVTSEDLLALPELRQVQGKRILLFRGKGGRELLAETLRERGAEVDYLELYTRRTPDYASDSVDELIKREAVAAIVVTSSQILAVLGHLLSSHETVRGLPVIVPSERVLEQAHHAGFTRVLNAGGADDMAILRALLQVRPVRTEAKLENTGTNRQ